MVNILIFDDVQHDANINKELIDFIEGIKKISPISVNLSVFECSKNDSDTINKFVEETIGDKPNEIVEELTTTLAYQNNKSEELAKEKVSEHMINAVSLKKQGYNISEIYEKLDITDCATRALKYDGKLRMDLIPPEAYEALARVLTYGAEKYSDNSWQGVERERYVAALMRHFVEYLKDPNGVDKESGLKHIDHLFCNAMFLNYMSCEKKEVLYDM